MCELCGNARHKSLFEGNTSVSSTSSDSATKPVYTIDQVADYLTQGFWEDTGRSLRSYDVAPGGQITVNLSALNAFGQETARQALDSWTALSGIEFVESSNAQITFDDNQAGAWASSTTSGSTIISTNVNIETGWSAYGDYYLQTYIHEIGHALGLGHTGNYNGSASYSTDAKFANDSWQMSVMSYFSQSENTYTDASYSFLATAQLADIAAIHRLYGTPTNIATGDTTYGDGETSGRVGMDLNGWSVAIVDNGGIDTINLASRSHDQMLNLGEETYSNLNGKIGNFAIGRSTVIENAITGSGTDHIIGNAADNRIESGDGNDLIEANEGNDILIGGLGADTLTGGTGADRFVYDALYAGDRITDFDLAAGDRVDITAILEAIGMTAADAIANGVVKLTAGTGGSWLTIIQNGSGTNLAFLVGVDASADVAEIINSGDTPPPPPPPPPVSADNVYTYTDSFISNWTATKGLVDDTNGGTDTIDVSAVTAASKITLTNGEVGRIGSKTLTISATSDIENLILGSGHDLGIGNDLDNLIVGNDGNDKLFGNDGNDTLDGGTGNDRLYGGAGDDVIAGGEGNNGIDGGAGNDTITTGSGKDKIDAGLGDNNIDAGDGMNSIISGDGNDTITAGAGRDRITAGDGDNVINAGDGYNMVVAGNGNNTVVTGTGADRILLGDGNHTVDAGDGRGSVQVGNGITSIISGSDADRIKGGDGAFILNAGEGSNSVAFGNGTHSVTTGAGTDRIKLGDGQHFVDAGDGKNSVTLGSGDSTVTGGLGDDRVSVKDGNYLVSVGDGKNSVKVENGNSTITAGSGNDQIKLGFGDSVVDAGNGMNNIRSEGGNTTITTGADNDRIKLANGNHTVDAGDGHNGIRIGDGNSSVISGAGDDRIVIGTGNITIDAGDGRNMLKTGDGDIAVTTGNGVDKIFTGAGNDTVYAGGSSDRIVTGEGNDVINGGAGRDALLGGAGDDILAGGAGFDLLSGQEGADVFVFTSANDAGDTIKDFNLSEGDTLDVDDLLIELGTTTQSAIDGGQLNLTEVNASNSWLTFDADGVGGEDGIQIALLKGVSADGGLSIDWFS